MAHDRQTPPSGPSRLEHFLLFLFLVALSLITAAVVFSELILFYFEVSPPESPSDLALDLEWYTRLHASALAFGAWVFVWYKIIIAYVGVLVQLGSILGLGCPSDDDDHASASFGNTDSDRKEIKLDSMSTNSDLDTSLSHRPPRNKDNSRVYVSFLLGVIIVNDCIFNRAREPQSQPLVCSTHSFSSLQILDNHIVVLSSVIQAIHTTICAVVPAALTRLTSMATHSFPICAIEVCVLFLVVYGIGYCISYYRSWSEPSSPNTAFRAH